MNRACTRATATALLFLCALVLCCTPSRAIAEVVLDGSELITVVDGSADNACETTETRKVEVIEDPIVGDECDSTAHELGATADDSADTGVTWFAYASCEWSIDASGALVIRPSDGIEGTLGVWPAPINIPWYARREEIRSVRFEGVVHATTCSYMFARCSALESVSLASLDTSNVSNMEYMFYECENLTSIDLDGIDTSHVTNFTAMFEDCRALTHLDLLALDSSSATNMSSFLDGCNSLVSVDFSSFNTSSVTNMSEMFRDCSSLTTVDLSPLDTSSVIDMSSLFSGCKRIVHLDLSPLNTSKVVYMGGFFSGCESLANIDLSPLDTSSVRIMNNMFSDTHALQSIDLSPLDTSRVEQMIGMFQWSGLREADISMLDMSRVAYVMEMFEGCSWLHSVNMADLNLSAATSMRRMFCRCARLTSLDMRGVRAPALESLYAAFYGCTELKSLDLSSLASSNVVDMANVFTGCGSLGTLDLSGINTSRAIDFSFLFYGCASLAELNISRFDLSSAQSTVSMFDGCDSLETWIVGEGYRTDFEGAMPSATAEDGRWFSTAVGKRLTPEEIVSHRSGLADTYVATKGLYTDMSNATVSPIEDQVFDWREVSPEVTVALDGKTLVKGEDYAVRYRDNESVGTATVLVTGKGSYRGGVTRTFKILPRDISGAQFESLVDQAYTGEPVAPSFLLTLKDGDVTHFLRKGIDYDVAFDHNVDVGTASVTVTGKGDFVGTARESFVIRAPEMRYGVDNALVEGRVSPKEDFYVEKLYQGNRAVSVAVTYRGNSPCVVVPSAIDGLPVVEVGSFNESDLVEEVYLPDTVETVDREAFRNCTSLRNVNLGGIKWNLYSRNYDWLLWGCTSLERLTMSDQASFSIEYTGDISKDLNIMDGETVDNLTYIYLGSSMANVAKNLFYGDALERVDVGEGNTAYSSYDGVVYSSDGKSLIVMGTAYDGGHIMPDTCTSVDTPGFNQCERVSSIYIPESVTSIKSTKAFLGCDAIIVTPRGSYADYYLSKNEIHNKVVYEGKASIPYIRDLSLAELSVAAQIYSGEPLTPSVSVTLDGVDLTQGTDYEVVYKNNVNAGTATATVYGKGICVGEKSTTFTIGKAAQEIVADDIDVKFDETAEVKAKASGDGRIAYRSLDESVALVDSQGIVTPVACGSAVIEVSVEGTANYEYAMTHVAIEVERAAQTISARNLRLSIGDSMPLGASVNGDGDLAYFSSDESILIIEADGTLSSVGLGTVTVTIIASGTDCYEEAMRTIAVTVGKAASTIKLASQSKTYTGQMLAYSGQVTRTGSAGDVTYRYYGDVECSKEVEASDVVFAGTYYVKAYLAADASYESATSAPVKLTVRKATSIVKLKAQTRTYTGKALAYTGKVTRSGSKGKLTYKYYSDKACKKAVKASAVKAAGTYYVKATVAADDNYNAVTSAAAKLTVAKAANPMSVKALARTASAAKARRAAVVVASPVSFARKAAGNVTYAKVAKGSSAALSVDARTGKVTVRKGTKKGTYKVVVKVTAVGDANHKSASKTLSCKVAVK